MENSINIQEINIIGNGFQAADAVTLYGTVTKKQLSYETTIGLDSTQLNKVINELQRNNPDANVMDLFELMHADSFEQVYYFNAGGLQNAFISMDSLLSGAILKQIRA